MQARNKALLQEQGSSGDEDEDATETPHRKSKTSPIVLSDDEAALAQELNPRVNLSSSSGLPDFANAEEDTIEKDDGRINDEDMDEEDAHEVNAGTSAEGDETNTNSTTTVFEDNGVLFMLFF